MSSPRRVVGGVVHAKACHVTSLAEATRRYGSLKNEKLLPGKVSCVEVIRNAETNRSQIFITAAYDFGGGVTKQKRLNIRSVRNGPVPNSGVMSFINNLLSAGDPAPAPVAPTPASVAAPVALFSSSMIESTAL